MTKEENQSEPSLDSDVSRPVIMRLSQNSLNKISELKMFFGCSNRVSAVVRSLNFTHRIAQHMQRGDKITISQQDGTKTELVLR